MNLKFAVPILAFALIVSCPKAEEGQDVAAKPADSMKPADNADTPKAPSASSTLTAASETFVGKLAKGGGKDPEKAAKKAAKKGDTYSPITLHVTKEKGDKEAKAKKLTLSASGDVLAQLNALAEKHAHVRVTGTLSGDTLTVKEVVEETEKKKKKDKNA